MEAKQVSEVAAILEVGAHITNVSLLKATRDGKEGWNLRFDYEAVSGTQSCILISQHNKPRFWVSLDTAKKEVLKLFPGIDKVSLIFNE